MIVPTLLVKQLCPLAATKMGNIEADDVDRSPSAGLYKDGEGIKKGHVLPLVTDFIWGGVMSHHHPRTVRVKITRAECL